MSKPSDKRLGIRRGGPAKQGERAQQIADAAGPVTAPKPQSAPAQGHTPGPWRKAKSLRLGRACIIDADNRIVAEATKSDLHGDYLDPILGALAERDRLRERVTELEALVTSNTALLGARVMELREHNTELGAALDWIARRLKTERHQAGALTTCEAQCLHRAALTRAEVKP